VVFRKKWGNMAILILTLILTVWFSLALTPQVIKFSKYIGVVDAPDSRKVHRKVMPRMGGAAFFLSFHLGLVLYFIFQDSMPNGFSFLIIGGGAIIFLLGLFDDIYNTSPKIKFLVQFAVAIFVASQGLLFDQITNPITNTTFHLGWMAYPLTVFWIVGISNAINLMDGLDGLAAGISTITLITTALVAWGSANYTIMTLSIILAGSVIGFLRYNFNPAKTFMGDCGSLYLGFMVATLSLAGSSMSPAALSLSIPILTLGLPIFDTLFAIFRRTATGRGPFSPDKEHIHHKLLSKGFSHKQTVLILYGITLVFCSGAFLLTAVNHREVAAIFILYFAILFFLVRQLNWMKPIYHRWARLTKALNHRLYTNNYQEPSTLTRVLRFFANTRWAKVPLDIFTLVFGWMAAGYLTGQYDLAYTHDFALATYKPFILLSSITLLSLNSPDRSRLLWRFIEFYQMVRYYRTATTAVLIAFFASPYFFEGYQPDVRFYFLVWFFLCGGLTLTRLSLNFYHNFIKRRLLQYSEGDRVLIFGAGGSGNLLQKIILKKDELDYNIVGFIDDDPLKQNRLIGQSRVLGKTSDIPRICKQNQVNKILLPIELSPTNKRNLLRFALLAKATVYIVYTGIKEAPCQKEFLETSEEKARHEAFLQALATTDAALAKSHKVQEKRA
jgi:UDP-GlcNAc:undecaprenyl-phosphate/decaprenyl-phosphate GlcNAc-1-phosphate transferase